MKQRRRSSERAARRDVMKQADAVAAAFKGFRPASEVLVRVRAVPTIFPQFDKATRVGGLPIERFTLLHGPSAGGKTYVSIGMMLSFLLRDHLVYFVDAERTTPITWLEKSMAQTARHPCFFAEKPRTYEQVVDNVQRFALRVKRLRDEGKIDDSTSALIVVDSLRKLVPAGEWERMMKETKDGAAPEAVKSRAAQTKAMMNAAWMDKLTPMLDETGTAMIAIAREIEDPDAPAPRAFKGRTPPKAVKTGGGKAPFYDASLDLRSQRLRAYGREVDGRFRTYGDVHQLDITKSKVSGKEEYKASCTFHISNGSFNPAGFDRSRDLVELARSLEVIEGVQGLKFGRAKWRSEDKAVLALDADPVLFAQIERECRALFKLEETR